MSEQARTRSSGVAAPAAPKRAEVAARCHELQVSLGSLEVPAFESVLDVGMAVRLALHIRGLPAIDYELLKSVAVHVLGIPSPAVRGVVLLLGEVGFAKLNTVGGTIKAVLPNVPYYEALYDRIGEFAAAERPFNETEELTLDMLRRLARGPQDSNALLQQMNADPKLFAKTVRIGTEGSFLIRERTRGRDVLLSPTYFSENASTFAELVVTSGTGTVRRAMDAVRALPGVPLSLLQSGQVRIDERALPADEVAVLTRLARYGAVKPPRITTAHAGEQHFLFPPTPTGAALPPTRRDQYERAMAIVAAVRQGQFLSKQYPIHKPGAVLNVLLRDGKLGKATTEAAAQYRNLVRHRVAQLVDVGNGFSELRLVDTQDNREALRTALNLVDGGGATGLEVDDAARHALTQDQAYVESMVAACELRKRSVLPPDEDEQLQLDMLLLGGGEV